MLEIFIIIPLFLSGGHNFVDSFGNNKCDKSLVSRRLNERNCAWRGRLRVKIQGPSQHEIIERTVTI